MFTGLRKLAEAATLDSRFKLINQENSGVSCARNTGISHAVGTWLYFIDSDDWVAPNTLETLLSQATTQEVDVLIGNGFRFTQNPEAEQRVPLLKKQTWGQALSGKQWIVHCVEQKEWPHVSWMQFIKREVITNHHLRYIEGIVHEDILWTTYLALNVGKMGFYPEPLYGYRKNHNSITGSTSAKSIQKRANSYIDVIRILAGIALTSSDPALRTALLLQVNRESGHFLGLLRKKITDPHIRSDLAKRFTALGIPSLLIKEKVNISSFWLTLRCTLTCYFYALRK